MKLLTVQLQPELAPALDLTLVRNLRDELASNSDLIESLAVTEGQDDGPYININVTTPDAVALWELVRQELFSHPALGQQLKSAAIVVCPGKSGWDDYLVLHHFDTPGAIDSLDSNP